MAVNFPDSPTNGQEVTVGTATYSYNSSKGVWVDVASVGAASQIATSLTVPTRGSPVSVSLTNKSFTVVGRTSNTSIGVS